MVTRGLSLLIDILSFFWQIPFFELAKFVDYLLTERFFNLS